MPSYSFTAPTGIIPTYDAELPWGLLEAYTMSVGRQIQRQIGVPMTRVRVDFSATATVLEVETTLGFPSSGELWLDGRRHTYTGTTASTFTGVSTTDGIERLLTIGVKTIVTPYLPAVAPA